MKRDSTRAFLILTFIALAVRLIYLGLHEAPPIENDAVLYHGVAANLAAGEGYTFEGSDFAAREPGYIFFVALIYLVTGPEPVAVHIAQAVAGSIACGLLVFVGQRFHSFRSGVMMASFLALWPPFIGYTDLVLTEVVTTMWVSVFLLLAGVLLQRPTLFNAVSLGVVAGTLALTRTNFILLMLLVPLLFLVIRSRPPGLIKNSLIATLVGVAVFAPWIVRNALVFDAFIPTRTGVGDILWSGSYIPWDGQWLGYKPPLTDLRGDLSPVEADRKLVKETIDNVREEPLGVALVWAKKPARILLRSDGSIYPRPPTEAKDWSLPAAIAQQLIWMSLFAFAFLSLLKHRDQSAVRFGFISLVVAMIPLLPGNPVPRYQVPLIPLVLLLAAPWLVSALERRRAIARSPESLVSE